MFAMVHPPPLQPGHRPGATPTPTALPGFTPWQAITGYAFGVGPGAVFGRVVAPGDPIAREADAALQSMLVPALPRPVWLTDRSGAVDRVLYWASAVQHEAGLEVFDVGRLLGAAASGDRPAADVVVPCSVGHPTLALRATTWAIQALAAGAQAAAPAGVDGARALIEQLRAASPKGKNTLQFLRAAAAAGMPWERIADNYYQFGWGARSRLLQSTFTDRTPVLAANLARDKRLAAIMLARAGLPAPRHQLVRSLGDALRAAATLGYPVVVKPADRDGGVGVAAGLRDPAAVRKAYEAAASLSRQVLVERHAEGRDYRLMTFDGELIWSILRIPGGVTGDGATSVEALVATLNRDPRRGPRQTSPLRTLDLDEEALDLLVEQGLSPTDVPAAGRFVRLRRTANMNRGGTATPVNELVHPDNRELALQATEAFGLDMAGIDLIIEDIGRSWRETGATICEVNAQPQMGGNSQKHVHGQILRKLVPQGGRIPVVVVIGAGTDALVEGLVRRLRDAGLAVGRATTQGAWLDGQACGQPDGLASAIRVLLSNRRVEALLVQVGDADAWKSGWPFDRADVLAVVDPIGTPQAACRLLESLNAVRARCVLHAQAEGCAADAWPIRRLTADSASPSDAAWVEAIVAALPGAPGSADA